MTKHTFICDAIRTPFGKLGGKLAGIRADDLGAVPMKALMERNKGVDWEQVDDVVYGCANQAGEDNRNVGRMSLLLAGLPHTIGGVTINRLCGSGMQAVAYAANDISSGSASLMLAGGVESMTRSPLVLSKAASPYGRDVSLYDSTLGWRFVNPLMEQLYGVDSLPQTAENLAMEHGISREDQDRFALASQQKTAAAQQNGTLAREIVPVTIPVPKKDPLVVTADEHPRATSMEALAKLKPVTGPTGTVTAGNASGLNDGACALLLADEAAVGKFNLRPMARILTAAVAGVPPRTMGFGPVPAVRKLLAKTDMRLDMFDIIELNEAFAAQALAVTRALKIADDDPRLNMLGGAIALGHPLGASGARLLTTAAYQLQHGSGRYALCSMCIGVGQGIAMALEKA